MTNTNAFSPKLQDEIPTIEPKDLKQHLAEAKVIDVRRPDEYCGELGHIEGATLATLGDDLTHFLKSRDRNEKIVFVCRSGGRSGTATRQSLDMGFQKTANMKGGMLLWNELGLPVSRD